MCYKLLKIARKSAPTGYSTCRNTFQPCVGLMPLPIPPHLLPDTRLHIYQIQGMLSLHQNYPDGFLGNWEEDGFSFLFFLGPVDHFIEELLEGDGGLAFVDQYAMTYGQWQDGSQAPVKAGSLTLLPSWVKEPDAADKGGIRLDAGIVFGDGLHPTSLTCIEAIERICAQTRISSMLDLGTGSGVLALAAVKLGCKRVVAVDNNYLAARTARQNAALNGFENQVLVVTGLAEECTSLPADLLVANIHHDIMSKIVRAEGFLQKKRFILSGLQHREADEIISILSGKPVVLLERIETGALWQTIIGAVASPR